MSFKVKNIIRVSDEIIEKILEKYADDEYFSMDKIIPIQPELEIYMGSNTEKSILYAISKKNDEELNLLQKKLQETIKPKTYVEEKESKLDYLLGYLWQGNLKGKISNLFDLKNNISSENLKELENYAQSYKPFWWEEELGINKLEDLGNAYLNNIINYDAMCAAHWCSKFWGSTGMTIIYEHKNNELILETEWATPIGIIDKLSKEFPNTIFSVEFASNGDDSCGKYEIKNGELVNCIDLESSDVWRIWNYTIDGKNNENEQQINNEYDDEWEDEMY